MRALMFLVIMNSFCLSFGQKELKITTLNPFGEEVRSVETQGICGFTITSDKKVVLSIHDDIAATGTTIMYKIESTEKLEAEKVTVYKLSSDDLKKHITVLISHDLKKVAIIKNHYTFIYSGSLEVNLK